MSLLTRLRTSFITGLFLIAPLAVTVFILDFVFDRLTGIILNPIVTTTRLRSFTGDELLLAQLLAATILAIMLTLIGYVASRELGRRLFGGLERGVRLVPLVRTIYFGVRQVSESLTRQSEGFDRVVLVEYPRKGIYSIGFVTNHGPRAAVAATENDELLTVFLPHSPNPTAGSLIMVPPDDVFDVDMSVRRGLRLVVTTGLGTEDVTDLPEGVVR
ncbi:DUF502 domain-containing protein [Halogeometricum borinquense]|uniref:DUF502 domain-containing protein n=1 Tax=Halogeometricum borinquense TaxID=60847 RepID=A0A6C0UFP7_9EURY|nr:DUF502 domain-containing protein [Halogeometricum borinquense]QIB73101.1 DUF502 domain-containing protein [Halogeometricum borinquense]QIQ77501.1 DUF502 domain-containing protein [Halogeometricum borinquense]